MMPWLNICSVAPLSAIAALSITCCVVSPNVEPPYAAPAGDKTVEAAPIPNIT